MTTIKYFRKLRTTFKEHPSYWWKIPGFILLAIVVGCSVKIDSVDQPASVNGGDIVPVQLNCTIAPAVAQTSKFMVAVLVPKIWKTAQNCTITFTSDITTGTQTMTLIPAGTPAPQGNGLDWPTLLANKIGHGKNLLTDYEWVAFYSDVAYAVPGNSFGVTVNIKMKSSPDNLFFKLGYCIAESTDGLSDQQYFSSFFPTDCFQVNGTGDLIDFCNPQLSVVDPRTSLDNDIVSLSFDGGVDSTGLKNASQVYLCIKGYTTDGDSITVCNQTADTKMDNLGLGKFRKDIWPRGLFKLSDNQHLSRLAYYFTDGTGSVKVGYGGGDGPFTYTFKCQ